MHSPAHPEVHPQAPRVAQRAHPETRPAGRSALVPAGVAVSCSNSLGWVPRGDKKVIGTAPAQLEAGHRLPRKQHLAGRPPTSAGGHTIPYLTAASELAPPHSPARRPATPAK